MSGPGLLIKLLDYVLEQAKDVDPRGFKLVPYRDFSRSNSEFRGLPGAHLDVKVDGDHIWLRVERLAVGKPPEIADPRYRPMILVPSDPSSIGPKIDEAAFKRQLFGALEKLPVESRPAAETKARGMVENALAGFLPLWAAWAEGERPRRKSIALYGDLFNLKNQMESEETAKPQELVWGIGIAAWKLPYEDRTGNSSIDFLYPLLTQTLEIAVEDKSLAILVRPRALEPRLEFDAFSACQIPNTAAVASAVREALAQGAERPVNPFDPSSYEHLLKLIAGNMHEKGVFSPDSDVFPPVTDDLLITNAWVLISRPRSNNYLHEDIERLKIKIRSGVEIPEATLAIVTPPSDEAPAYSPIYFRGLSGTSTAAGGKETQELYFPLPYNQEQITIVDQLSRATGVAVQGPPGTGKTHTIANIVCHYLAMGKKVLVTSKGEQALEVLQSKMPDAVRPLTVALLAGDREGMRQFQTSIEAIIHNVSQLNVDLVREQIANTHSAIDRAHAEVGRIDKRVNEIAYSQLSNIKVDGLEMNASKMAELVANGVGDYSWFDDTLSLQDDYAPPFGEEEMSRLRSSRRALGEDLVYLSARTPASGSLPTTLEIGRLHQVLVDMRNIDKASAAGTLPPLQASTPEVLADARTLLQKVESAASIAKELEESGASWAVDLRAKCGQPSYRSERSALEALFDEMQELLVARAEFLKRPVEVPDAVLSDTKAWEAIRRAAETGRPFPVISIGSSELKAHVSAIKVSGLAPRNPEDWRHVGMFVALHRKVLSFCTRWNEIAALLSMPLASGGVAALRNIEVMSSTARKAHELATQYDAVLPNLAAAVFARSPVKQLQGSHGDLITIGEHLRAHLTRAELALASAQLATLQEKLAGTSGPVSDKLRNFAESALGSGKYSVEKMTAFYAETVSELRRVEALAHDLGVVAESAAAIERAGAHKLALRIRTKPVMKSGEDETLPARWRAAWTWSRLRAHLEGIEAREELVTLSSRRRDLEKALARLYEEVVSHTAWMATKINASPRVLSALETYRTAVRRIGMGTGPNAFRHRRDAQKAMLEAQGAVPCWVMSHAKVSETLPADLGCFDLVIVDEASQSDLWALPAVLRGKKVLVVGDDKQVSPDGGFINATHIQSLRARFLSGQPYEAVLTPEKSLYDIASTVFASNKVMLREHFRCVPPIIAYSNQAFYNDFIQPLRIPRASERLDPPLVDIFVAAGARSAKDVNQLEADAIVEEIQAILSDERFAGRTLGVVSLLGPDQAKHIDSEVRRRCDAAELMRRRFDCGDARRFQGSERDIMFLSMVVNPGNCRALSGNMFEQRFNVAATRARDRMYLVRSVELSDLSGADGLRRGLLGHFSKPVDNTPDEQDSLINDCESGFEKQVYTELFQRGYRVTPQIKAGSFRIDLVVEGANDARLAIECDGDEFHGPDRWAADMSRQRVLERAGWTFWRCFASTWSLKKDEVIDELLSRMKAMGIDPLGRLSRMSPLVESRVWKVTRELSGDIDGPAAILDRAVSASKES